MAQFNEEIENKIIALAHEECKTNFMQYPDYDPNIEIGLADALTILMTEKMGDDTDTNELFEFFDDIIRSDKWS